jgi:hypothetical protein
MLMTSDIDNASVIVEALIEAGYLKADDNGGVFSPRAIREGERAFAAWEAKSQGGKNTQRG